MSMRFLCHDHEEKRNYFDEKKLLQCIR